MEVPKFHVFLRERRDFAPFSALAGQGLCSLKKMPQNVFVLKIPWNFGIFGISLIL